nr:CAP domain-containing protein [Paracoccus tibetensis]
MAIFASACSTGGTSKGPSSGAIDVQASAPGDAWCVPTTSAHQTAGVKATNAIRSRSGLPAVTANSLLAQAAALHACDMAERGRMTHGGSRTSGPSQRLKALGYTSTVTAENIAAGPFGLERVLAEWSASPGHIANIMIPRISEFGIGEAVGSDNRTRYWAAVYSAPRGR